MFYPYEGYRSVTPLDAARVNKLKIKMTRSVRWVFTENIGRFWSLKKKRKTKRNETKPSFSRSVFR